MVVGIVKLDLFLHTPQNLKEKRGIVRKILGRCRERFPVSGAEVGHHDLWQRTQIGFAVVSQSEAEADSVFSRLENEIASIGLADVTARDIEFIHL